MTMLLRWRPKESFFAVRRAVAVVMLWLAATLPAVYAMVSYNPATLPDADETVVVLKPETWVGKTFPLLSYIDIGSKLKEGKWVVLLYHYRCPDCREAIPRYERLAGDLATQKAITQVAIIEVPPYTVAGESLTKIAGCAVGRLDDSKKWFVRTPVEVRLDGGIVCRVGEKQKGTLAGIFEQAILAIHSRNMRETM